MSSPKSRRIDPRNASIPPASAGQADHVIVRTRETVSRLRGRVGPRKRPRAGEGR